MNNTPDSLAALKPCPFCGGKPTASEMMDESLWNHGEVPYRKIECGECGIGTGYICEGEELTERDRWQARADALERQAVPEEVMDALFAVDDYIARVNGDDRGSNNSVNVLRGFLESLASSPSAPAQPEPIKKWCGLGKCVSRDVECDRCREFGEKLEQNERGTK